ncbi:aminotransferase class I/II-fold pyridoxal phosphate-dependent enzyme [Streptosporangium sp. DT93]|uniref:pyridoxal phosphate-dependent aminotransferase n=1 Tax=Streptosporangium sp. DT93 TaxID=3393428 RepID=UPI003CF7AC7D
MAGSIDRGRMHAAAHSPSVLSLLRAAPEQGADLVDFRAPGNPYFPTPEIFGILERDLAAILRCRPSDADTITAELCGVLGLNPQTVVMGNGATELVTWIDHLLVGESLAVPIPTSGRWTDQPLGTGKRVDMYPLQESQGFALDVDAFVAFVRHRGSRVAVVCNPGNPGGGYLRRHEVISLLDRLVDLDLVVVDESFIDFADAEPYPSVANEAAIRPNVVVLKSLGENFGLHGVRFGYLVANPALAARVRGALPRWNLNSFAETLVFMIRRYLPEYLESLRLLALDRESMHYQLTRVPGLAVFPSQGNFLLVRLPAGRDGVALRDRLLDEHGLLVRACGDRLGMTGQFVRLAVRPEGEVRRLVSGLYAVLYESGDRTPSPVPTPQPIPTPLYDPLPGTASTPLYDPSPILSPILPSAPPGVPVPLYEGDRRFDMLSATLPPLA